MEEHWTSHLKGWVQILPGFFFLLEPIQLVTQFGEVDFRITNLEGILGFCKNVILSQKKSVLKNQAILTHEDLNQSI